MGKGIWIGVGIGVVIVAGGTWQLSRPLPYPQLKLSSQPSATLAGTAPNLPWPAHAQATVSVPGIGSFGRHGPSQPGPIGSITKDMTAYLVLKAHPLGVYSNGPTLTITPQEVAAYRHDASTNQSVMPVTAGEKLSERTLLEGLLVGSGNNVAQILAQWVGGSTAHFVATMNQTAQSLGMHHTLYVGPSGLNPKDASTASDQVRLAEVAMKIPAFAQIVAMPQMTVPGQSAPEENYNYLVGHGGIIGVKTGSTTVSGGCFIFAGRKTIAGQARTVYGGVLGQLGTQTSSQLMAALQDGRALFNAAASAIHPQSLVRSGQAVATLTTPWARSIPVVATHSAALLGWSGLSQSQTLHWLPQWQHATAIKAGTVIGNLTVKLGQQSVNVPVALQKSLTPPSWQWRLKRL